MLLLTKLLIALIVACVTWLYIKWHKMKTYWIKKGIPQSPIHPILGSLTFFQKVNPNIWLTDIYKQYATPYVGIWVFWRRGLIVNTPSLARNILVKDSNIFRNRNAGSGQGKDVGSLHLFSIHDPQWSLIRKRLSPVFTAAKLRGWQELYRSKAIDLIYRINSDTENGIHRNLKTLFADYTTDIIGESSFGIKCEATRNNGSGPLRAMTKVFEQYSMYRGLQWFSLFFLPELASLLGFSFWPKQTIGYFHKVFNMIVQERGGYEKETDGKRDLMDALVKMKQDSANDFQDLSEVVVISNALIFLQGGYDTSATTLAYLTYELAYKPEYQQNIYEEVMNAKCKINDPEFEANLAELPLLNAAIKETLRKYPVMGWLDRIATEDYQVDDHLTIPAGTVVYVNGIGMHHDPKLFPEPYEFKPERFLPENEQNIVPYSYMPFGEGPRSCIGKRFGLYTVRYALAGIITNFIIKPLPNAPVPNDLTVESKGILYMPREELSVDFVPRDSKAFKE